VLCAAIVCAGCSGLGQPPSPTPLGVPPAELRVALAYDLGGRGDRSFNDSAAQGLDEAKRDLGISQTFEAEADRDEVAAQKESRLRFLASNGYSPIIAVGFSYAEPLGKVAPQYPGTMFAIVDDATVTGPNIYNLLFAEEQGSFLVGAAGALKSRTKRVGFIGGVRAPVLRKFEAGYAQGVKHVRAGTQVQVQYLTKPPDYRGFDDPAKGKAVAAGMYSAGNDVVYQAAGGSGVGVFEAAKAANEWAIGVDSDQAATADAAVRGHILTSMVKKVNVAVYDFIASVVDGTAKSGPVTYDLKAGGVDYSTTGGHIEDIQPQLETLKQKIINGEIKVTTG
jgi:basic membrane protein A and related proteins